MLKAALKGREEMKALLLVAHGSRRQRSNDEVHVLAQSLKAHCQQQYDIVQPAFLELAEPLIPEGIKACVDAGANSVTVLPYFLNSGRHVTEDIPHEVDATRSHYPQVKIDIAPHIGGSDAMVDVLIRSANQFGVA